MVVKIYTKRQRGRQEFCKVVIVLLYMTSASKIISEEQPKGKRQTISIFIVIVEICSTTTL